jgi:hypothetical protein
LGSAFVLGGGNKPPFLGFLGLGVAGEMDFDALWEEAFTAALATSRESGAPALGAHAGTKPVLLLSCALGAL